jgi:membrane protease YdiL (CAAX protease family)
MTNENFPDHLEQEQPAIDNQPFIDRHSIHPLIFAFGSLCLVFILYQVLGGILTFILVGATSVTRENVSVMRWLTLSGQLCFILIPTLLITRLFTNRLREVFPFRVPGLLESSLALLALFSLQRVMEAYMYFQEQIPMPDLIQKIVEPMRKMFEEVMKALLRADSPLELLTVILVVAIVPSVIEELLFRGLIQKVFERLMSPIVSAVLAGTIFGLYHLNFFEIVPLVCLGVFFGLLRYRSQSLLLPIAAHFFNNLMAVLASFYGLQDENLLAATQSSVNIPTILFELVIFSGLFCVVFIAYLRLTHHIARGIR